MSNILPININLRKKVVDTDKFCSIYEMHEESVEHILRDCPWSFRLWFLSLLGLAMDSFTGVDFVHCMVNKIFLKKLDVMEMALMLM